MSMHEMEALAEASIRLLGPTEGLDHRSMFKSLYDLEGAFDRLFDILLKRRFAYRMALGDHARRSSRTYRVIHRPNGIAQPIRLSPTGASDSFIARPARRYGQSFGAGAVLRSRLR